MNCNLCPRQCNIDRSNRLGFCNSPDLLTVARVVAHFDEEPPISGSKGSGTIFFCGCNLKCRYCQNLDISIGARTTITVSQLADCMLYLQDQQVHNINLVTPSHYSTAIARALDTIKHRLHIPVVYNTNSYESVDALRRLQGLIDIYLPDLKYCDSVLSQQLSQAADYFAVASNAVVEMLRQQPDNIYSDGMLIQGVVIRHLVLPMQSADSKKVLDWIASVDKEITVSLMRQYFATHQDEQYKYLNSRVSARQYNGLVDYCCNIGLRNVFTQLSASSDKNFVPKFDIEATRRLVQSIKGKYEEK